MSFSRSGRGGRVGVALSLAVLIAAAAACDELPGRGEGPEEVAARSTVAPVFWVGRSFEGLDLEDIHAGPHGGGVGYGSCRPPDDEGGCALPLQIQSVRVCRTSWSATRLGGRRTLRGVPAGTRGGAVVLLSRSVEIRVFARDEALALRAVAALASVVPAAPGGAGAGEPLPPPPTRPDRRAPCPDSAAGQRAAGGG